MAPQYRNGSPTIGVLAGWQFYRTATNLSYLKPIFSGINRAAQDLGCNLLLGCGMGASASPADPIRPAWPIPSPDVDYVPIGPLNTEGLIVFSPLHSAARSEYVHDLIRAGHPVLFIGSGENGPTIVADNAGGIIEAVGHLVSHGHRRIAFIAGSPDDIKGDTGDRLGAYRSALMSYGLESDPRLVVYGRHVYHGGYASMRQIIDSGVAYTAVLASNDESAIGAMQALKETGRKIPQDVAVMGFDDRLEGTTQEPALSSVHVPLFHIGYRAVELLLQHIEGQTELGGAVKVNTQLVLRESCGCGLSKLPTGCEPPALDPTLAQSAAPRSQWAQAMATAVLNQAQNLAETECQALCQRLAEAFAAGVEANTWAVFQKTLAEALQKTVAGEDDAHIWQAAVTFLDHEAASAPLTGAAPPQRVREILDQARLAISAQLQRQHRHHLVDQRWANSRLSLLTANLLTALDETRIYEILAQHLPEMDIHVAMIALFEAEGDNRVAWSTLRNVTTPEQAPIRFPSLEFPPNGLFGQNQPFQLALIPLVDQTRQLGFAVFGTEYFDLYGAIVQQLGGAFNTVRLYRQATEGRRLAEEANRMKSRFLSTISHELRTPLNLIVGLSGMVLRESDDSNAPLPEPARRDIDRIHVYSQHLGGLIGDVVDLATSDAGQLRLSNDYVDLGQALRLVAESGRQLAADKGLAWEVNLPETGPWVWGDQTRLRQVALNLITNAIKFTTSGGVSLRLEDNPCSATVTVRDTGLGISPDEQQVIFDEFRQSERSVARGYGGLGLGLAISKRLVEMHGGMISVHSTGVEGAGSTFTFTLPTVQPPLAKAQSLGKLPATKQSVVLLTNQPGTSERLHEDLLQRGFTVQIGLMKPGLDWRSQLDEWRPDTIILDVSTDSALGWQALKEIKGSQTLAGIPVLFFSSSQRDGSLLELDYLTKPVEISGLARALDQHWVTTGAGQPTRTILVVDDEPNTLEMHARIVQAHSASNRVLKAHSGKEALDCLHSEIVDLILLDLQMPEMDGFEVLEVIRGMESTRKIPVIVVTGKILTETDMARLNQGVAAVLGKGLFNIEETIGHISAALEHKRRLSVEAQRLVRAAMAYMHENFAEALSRRDIAQHIGISEDHLTFCFRQELGTTPIEYLQRYRINQAKRLLKESQQTITEIALSVGFSDSGYFSRIFRRETSMSPEAFRRS
jgi:signal transduction histidine kinase/DNA-binding LacI/PurR family transcriptional regulator/AraC-like DNA-binding protein